jgi:hypothetical protein
MDSCGYLLGVCVVHDAAKILLEQRVSVFAKIRVNWAQHFIKQQPQLSPKYTYAYNYQKAQYEDSEKL